VPERAAAKCPACGSKELRRGFEPFHLGVLLVVLGIAAGGVELGRAATAPELARVQAKKVVLAVQEGPARGRRITLRRGDVVEVKGRDGETLVVVDAEGNQVRVKLSQVELQ
jgi:hypothetical protein